VEYPVLGVKAASTEVDDERAAYRRIERPVQVNQYDSKGLDENLTSSSDTISSMM
jgi:hypothetical protein